jgi:hypothetical protein
MHGIKLCVSNKVIQAFYNPSRTQAETQLRMRSLTDIAQANPQTENKATPLVVIFSITKFSDPGNNFF